MAAVLAAGPGAALSHRSAAELWGLLPGCSSPVHVTVPGAGGRARRRGMVLHRARVPTVRHRAVPVTEPLRTLRDLRTGRLAFERAVAEAERRRLIGHTDAAALLPDGNPTQNDFEEAFLTICREHGIAPPTCQVEIGPYTVDFLFAGQSVVVETDGRASHGTRAAFEDDRARDAELAARGYVVLRFTWRQLTQRPGWVARTLRAALTV